jgi:hypothetical protein
LAGVEEAPPLPVPDNSGETGDGMSPSSRDDMPHRSFWRGATAWQTFGRHRHCLRGFKLAHPYQPEVEGESTLTANDACIRQPDRGA